MVGLVLLVVLVVLLVLVLNYLMHKIMLMLLLMLLMFLLLLLTIPESPRYLVVKRRKEDALRVLTRLLGRDKAQLTLDEIEASLSTDHHRPRLSDLRSRATGRIRPIVWVGVGLACFQQLVGINVVFYYGAVLWQAVGFSENDALLINVLSGALSIGACLVTVLLIDRIGRKPLLWIGSVGMSVSLALVVVADATSQSQQDAHDADDNCGPEDLPGTLLR